MSEDGCLVHVTSLSGGKHGRELYAPHAQAFGVLMVSRARDRGRRAYSSRHQLNLGQTSIAVLPERAFLRKRLVERFVRKWVEVLDHLQSRARSI